jgi:2-isopropylmalate synthase
VLKDARTYEIMKPEDVGQSVSSRLVLGRHSGRHACKRAAKRSASR